MLGTILAATVTVPVLMCHTDLNTRISCFSSLHVFYVLTVPRSVKGGSSQRGQSSIQFCEQAFYSFKGLLDSVKLFLSTSILHRAWSALLSPLKPLKSLFDCEGSWPRPLIHQRTWSKSSELSEAWEDLLQGGGSCPSPPMLQRARLRASRMSVKLSLTLQ